MNAMAINLGVLLVSFLVTSILIVPFINLLYKLRFQKSSGLAHDVFGKLAPIFHRFHQKKAGVPIGGGLLLIAVISGLFAIFLTIFEYAGINITSVYEDVEAEINILFFTFLSFGLLGLYDDIKKFFHFQTAGFFGLRMPHKLFLEILLALIVSLLLYFSLGISILNIPFVGAFELGLFYIPFATFTIVAFANAVNITDGLDGLASGLLMISLFGLWFLSSAILDVPLSLFLALWIGALISFLYFNVFPARLFLGDVGALAFGATLAVVGLLLGKVIALVVIGFIFVAEIASSLIQLLARKFLRKRVFPAAPLHLSLQHMNWEEPKIVQRAWLMQIVLTLFGVWLAVL